jgi:uncharacterized protein (TIGR03435 family)
MHQILQIAWGLSSAQISGPSWIDSDRYDIDAKAPDGAADTESKPLLQTFLKERFHLEAHSEMKELPVYDLVVMNSGLKIHHPDPEHPLTQPPRMPGACCMLISFQNTMDRLAKDLAGPTKRPVINETGLEGGRTYALQYAQLSTASNDIESAPDIFGAVQQQLGLKLESGKAAVPTLIVDHADRVPTGN